MSTQCLPSSSVQSDLQFGSRCGLLNFKMATMDIRTEGFLHNTPMPPIKFQLKPTYSLEDVILRISRWLSWHPSLKSEQNDFSNSEFPCCPNASNQLSAKSDLPLDSRSGLKIFKMAATLAILDIGMEQF